MLCFFKESNQGQLYSLKQLENLRRLSIAKHYIWSREIIFSGKFALRLEDIVQGDGWSPPIWDKCWRNFGMACCYQDSFRRYDLTNHTGVTAKIL